MKLSGAMVKMLRSIDSGYPYNHYCRGRSQFGGAVRVLCAAFRRGLIMDDADGYTKLTDAGRKALKENERT